MPANLASCDSRRIFDLITHQRPVKRGDYLYRAGSELGSLFAICSGFLKSSLTYCDGRGQITGFSMTGDLLGVSAISTGMHVCDTVALEDSRLCGMRYADFEALGRDAPALQHHFHRIMSAEITTHHEIMFLLGSMRAEERVAVFLLGLSQRYSARGYSGRHFRLPMTRHEIASYIGLKLETVSRAFSRFSDSDIIAVNGKNVEIRDVARLRLILPAGN